MLGRPSWLRKAALLLALCAGGIAASAPSPVASGWTADPDDQFLLDVNIRAQFYQLLSSIRAMYDPAAIKDPRDLGLLDAQGNAIRRTTAPPGDAGARPTTPDEAPIQPRESETVR